MVKKLAIIREIFKGDHNEVAAVVARKLTLNYLIFYLTVRSSIWDITIHSHFLKRVQN